MVKCPQCEELNEFQTKSGSCILSTYNINNVPKEELKGIYGYKLNCKNCGYLIEIKNPNSEFIDGRKFVE